MNNNEDMPMDAEKKATDYRARLATEIRSALGEFNDGNEPVVTLVRQLAEKARALSQPATEGVVRADILREAGDVLEAVGASGVSLPSNWRWPLADELHGMAAMLAAAPEPPATDGWRPIETAPKSLQEIADLYKDRVGMTVLIGRAERRCETGLGVYPGFAAECTLLDDGRWASPESPELRSIFRESDGWIEVVDATHWMPLPAAPKPGEGNNG